jgi:hypothetical protein
MRHQLRLSIAPGSVIAAACIVDHHNGEHVFMMSVVSEVYDMPLGGSEPFVAVAMLLLLMIGTLWRCFKITSRLRHLKSLVHAMGQQQMGPSCRGWL